MPSVSGKSGEVLRQQLAIELADGRALDARHGDARGNAAGWLADQGCSGRLRLGRQAAQVDLRRAAEEEEGAQTGRNHGVRALAQASGVSRHSGRIG